MELLDDAGPAHSERRGPSGGGRAGPSRRRRSEVAARRPRGRADRRGVGARGRRGCTGRGTGGAGGGRGVQVRRRGVGLGHRRYALAGPDPRAVPARWYAPARRDGLRPRPPEHALLRDTIRDFMTDEVAPVVDEHERERRFPRDIVDRLGEMGWLGIPVPEDEGGAGLDTLAYAIAIEEIGRVWGSLGLIVAAHTSLGCGPLLLAGDRRAEGALPRPDGLGQGHRRLRADGAGRGQRCRRHADDRPVR